jgi:hypothetical protein
MIGIGGDGSAAEHIYGFEWDANTVGPVLAHA